VLLFDTTHDPFQLLIEVPKWYDFVL
jgi:hypothetical protein